MRIDSPIMTNAVATGSFTGSFSGIHYGDGSNLTGVTSYTDSDTLAYINTLNVLSGSDGYTTDAELNASSSALISGYTNADTSLSSSLATALTSEYQAADTNLSSSLATAITSEYQTADTNLSSSLASAIAVNTAKVGYTDTLVKTKLNAENVVSASSFSSPSQGTVRATINGVNTDVDTGLQVGDSPTFTNLLVTGNLTVQGTKTELQVTELNVEDKNITIASGAADSAAADGAGITIAGANESITWNHANSRFNVSDDLHIEGNITLTGTVDGVDIAQLSTDVSNLNNTFATDAELNASSSALITAYGNADNALSSSLATAITSEYQTADTNLSSSLASDIATNAANISINAGHISALHSFTSSLNNTYATDAELNASSSALITAYGNADNALSSSLATAITSEYVAADTALSSSLASAIATNTAKIGVTTETVRTAGALMDDEVDADIKTLSLPASTTISAFGKTLVDDADAATARTTLGVDAAGTDNSTDVTLAGSYDYITIAGQVITRNQVDYTTDISNTPTIPSAIFSTIAVSGQSNVVADSATDTLTLEAGSNVTITTNATTDTVTIASAHPSITAASSVNNSGRTFIQDITLDSNGHVTGITSATDADTYVGTVTSVSVSGSTGLTGTGTVTTSGTINIQHADTSTQASVNNSGRTFIQDITLDGFGHVTAITSATDADTYVGTVTSVGGIGTVNGLSLSGIVTTSGSLTLGGTLAISNADWSGTDLSLANGGTGASLSDPNADRILFWDDSAGAVTWLAPSTGVTISGTSLSIGQDVATSANVSFGSVTTTGNITIGGDLTVLGTRTELQVTSLNVEDKNILIASGAADSAAADGAGITIGGANETITWDHANSRFDFSDDVNVTGNITLSGTVDGRDIATDGSKLDGIAAGANNYTHPSYTARSIDTSGASVLDVFTSDASGHVTNITTRTLTLADLGYTGATDADKYTSWTIQDGDTTTYTITSGDTLQIASGTGITSNFTADDVLTITNTGVTSNVAGTGISVSGATGAVTITNSDRGSSQNIFKNFAVSGQSTVVADSNNDTLTLVAGTNVSITTDATTDAITINSTDQYVGTVTSVAGAGSVNGLTLSGTVTSTGDLTLGGTLAINNADWSGTDLSLANGGTGASLTDPNADRILFWDDSAGAVTWLAPSTGISISGTSISNSGVTSNVAGTGVSVSSGTGAVTISIGQSVATSADVQFNSIGVGTAAPGTAGLIRATNDIVAYYSSDKNLKDNINPIENALEKVEALGGYEFDWNDKQDVYTGHDLGVIAQEVEAVFPELVQTRDNGYKAVKYEKLTAVLIQAVKELSAKVTELENKLK